MFCKNCGNQLNEGAAFCTACGTKVEQPAVEQAAPVVEQPIVEAPVAETPETVEAPSEVVAPEAENVVVPPEMPVIPPIQSAYAPAPQPPVKKKKKKVWLVLGIIVAILAAIAVPVILFWDYVVGFFMGFMPAERQLKYTYNRATDQVMEEITPLYGKLLRREPQDVAAEGSITLELGELLSQTLKQQLGVQNLDLSKVQLAYRVDQTKDGNLSCALTAKVADKELLTGKVFEDAKGNLYLSVPALSDKTLKLDPTALYAPGNGNGEMAAMPTSMRGILNLLSTNPDAIIALLPSEELVSKLLPAMIDAALEQITEAETRNEKVTIGSVTQTLKVIEVELSPETLSKMAIAALEVAKTDEDVEAYVKSLPDGLKKLMEQLGVKDGELPDDDELYDLYADGLDEAIEALEDVDEDDTILVINTYVDAKYDIVALSVADGDDKMEAFIGKVQDGNNVGYELSLYGDGMMMVEIIGDGTEVRGKLDATFTVCVMDQEYLVMECKELDTKAWEENGSFLGTVTLTPGKALKELMKAELGMDKASIEIVGTEGTVTLRVDAADMMIGKLTFTNKVLDNPSVTIPTDVVTDPEEWGKNLNLDALGDILSSLGIGGAKENEFGANVAA